MFNIIQEKKTGKKWSNTKKPYPQAQIKAMLENYELIDENKWSNIPKGIHIRYIKKDGKFVKGGFVVNHWINDKGKKFIHLSNGYIQNRNYISWPMSHDNVSKVYTKIKAEDPSIENLNNRVRDIMKSINNIVSVVKRQEKKILTLEAQNKQLLGLTAQNTRN